MLFKCALDNCYECIYVSYLHADNKLMYVHNIPELSLLLELLLLHHLALKVYNNCNIIMHIMNADYTDH